MPQRSLGHRAPLLWLAIPFATGLAIGRIGEFLSVSFLLAVSFAAGAFGLFAAWRWRRGWWAVGVAAAMVCAGAATYPLCRPRLVEWEKLPPREVRLTLQIERLFPTADRGKSAGLAVVVSNDKPTREIARQRLYFSLRRVKSGVTPITGAIISAVGVLAPLPRDPPASSFDGFLAGAGINFRFTRGKILAELKPAPTYRRFCAHALDRLSGLLGVGVDSKRPALVGVLRAMMLGQQHELTTEQTTMFRQSGTMHVFSISGLHITVISLALEALLLLVRMPRWCVLALSLPTLWLYVDITGTAPSAVRAFVMVAFVQIARTTRLARNPLSALSAAALVVLVTTPLDIFSASFQMSYGIVAALMLLGLPLADRWLEIAEPYRDLPKVSWRWYQRIIASSWRGLVSALAIGVASALVSAVTGAEFFSMLTPGSLLANLWVIPASSLVILLGLVSLLAGLLHVSLLCDLANHSAVLLLWGVDYALRLNLRLPGMWFGATFRWPGVGPLALVALLVSLGVGYAYQWRGWCRGFWPPFAVVALALIFGLKFG